MGETWSIIYWGKIILQLGIYETKQMMCFLNTIVGEAWDRHSHSKRNKKKGREARSHASPKLIKANFMGLHKNNPLWLTGLPSRPVGRVVSFSRPFLVPKSVLVRVLQRNKMVGGGELAEKSHNLTGDIGKANNVVPAHIRRSENQGSQRRSPRWSLNAGEDWGSSSAAGHKGWILPFSGVLFYLSPQQIGWCPPIFGRQDALLSIHQFKC